MKFKKLAIHNIASIADAVINFENPVLANESLLLICGETGSGKSSILDAICLALYGTTPRMKAAKVEELDENININSVKQLLRKGEKECFVNLEFEGCNGVDYMAHWECSLTRNNTFNEPKRLLKSNNGFSETKKDPIKDEIEVKAVGMTIDNFCRTTLLAQGEFSKFLDSKEDEKSAVLEHLTGTGIYALIGKQIYDVYKAKQNAVDKANEKIEDKRKELLDDESKAEKRQQIANLEQQAKDLQAEATIANNKANWLTQATSENKKHEESKKLLEQNQQTANSDSYKQETKLATDYREAQDILVHTENRGKAKAELEKLTSYEPTYKATTQHTANAIASNEKVLEYKNNELKTINSRLTNITDAQRNSYEMAEAILTNLGIISKKAKEEADHKQNVASLAEYLPLLTKAVDEKRQEIERLQGEIEAVNKTLDSLKANLNTLNPEAVTTQQGTLSQLKGKLGEAKTLLGSLKDKKETLKQALEAVASDTETLPRLEEMKKGCETAYNKAKEVYDHLELSANQYAKELRSKYKKGDICPVCGREIIEEMEDSFFESMLVGPKNKLDTCAQDLTEANSNLETAKKTAKVNKANKEKYEEEVKKATDIFSSKLGEIENVYSLLPILSFGNKDLWEDLSLIESQETIVNEELDNLDKKQAEIGKKREEIDQQQKTVNTLNTKLGDLQKEFQEKEKAVSNKTSEIENEKKLAGAAHTDVIDATNNINKIFGSTSWQKEALSDPAGFGNTLKTAAVNYNNDLKSKQALETTIIAESKQVETAKATFEQILNLCPGWTIVATATNTPSNDLIKETNNAFQNINSWKENCINQQKTIATAQLEIDRFLQSQTDIDEQRLLHLVGQKDNVLAIESNHKTVEDNIAIAQTQLEGTETRLKELEKSRPHFVDDEESFGCEHFVEIAKTKQLEAVQKGQQKGLIEGDLKNDQKIQEQIASQLAEIKKKETELAPWAHLNTLFGDAQGKTFRKIAQNYVLDVLLEAANRHLKKYAPRFTLFAKPGQLTILVRDDENFGEALSSTSLSGGQKFMVSLSLALGLAEMCGGIRNGADILFIDEGFGSLDDKCLDKVMHSLEQLQQNTQRKVAIISHVERLRDEVPVHLEVKHLPGSNSASKVVLTNLGEEVA